MTTKHLFASIILYAVAITVSAQVDWQTGGGAGEVYSGKERTFKSNSADLWNGGHEDCDWAFTIGYVNKSWDTDFGSYKWHENLWGEEGKLLHGVQFGVDYNPCFAFGLGVHTGLFYEAYFSDGIAVRDYGYDDFTEHNIYMPAHLMYRLPMSRNASVMLFGGFGFNWAFSGEFSEDDYWEDGYGNIHYDSEHIYYRGEGWPKPFNVAVELGGKIRINHVLLGCTYSLGITDHRFYYPEAKTRQNKLNITLGYAF